MKVLMIGSGVDRETEGGVASYVEELSSALERLGHVVVNPDGRAADAAPPTFPSASEPTEGPNLSALAGVSARYFRRLHVSTARLADLLRSPDSLGQIDVVHTQDVFDVVASAAVARAVGAPLVLTKHYSETPSHQNRMRWTTMSTEDRSFAEHIHRYTSELERWGLERAAGIIAVSEWVKHESAALVPSCVAKTTVIHPAAAVRAPEAGRGLNPDDVPAATAATDRPSRLLLLPGRLIPMKGADVALRALSILQDRTLRLVLAGAGSYRAHLEELTRELGISDRVTFLGFVGPEVLAHWYGAADIVLVPSRLEPFGLTVAEGMSFGKVVIASDVGGPREQIQDGTNGFLFESENPESLARAISRVIGSPRAAAEAAASARAGERGSWKWRDVADATARVYAETVSAQGGPAGRREQ